MPSRTVVSNLHDLLVNLSVQTDFIANIFLYTFNNTESLRHGYKKWIRMIYKGFLMMYIIFIMQVAHIQSICHTQLSYQTGIWFSSRLYSILWLYIRVCFRFLVFCTSLSPIQHVVHMIWNKLKNNSQPKSFPGIASMSV